MAGFDPAIHAPKTNAGSRIKCVDARVEPGHDDGRAGSAYHAASAAILRAFSTASSIVPTM
jgi:hypothetical protein